MTNRILIIFSTLILHTACSKTKTVVQSHTKPTTESVTNQNEILLKKGANFFAYGQEPFWNMEIYNNKQITLQTINQPSITIPITYTYKIGLDTTPYVFYLNHNETKYSLIYMRKKCVDVMSGAEHAYTVFMMNNTDTFRGCGINIYDKTINGTWELTAINGKTIPVQTNVKFPIITVNGDEQQVSGSGSCNKFSGTISINANTIGFTNMSKTLAACPNQLEPLFLQILPFMQTYKVTNNQLLLTGANGHSLLLESAK